MNIFQLLEKKITYEVDTSYRNINRVLKKLADINIIQINRSIIKITDLQTLQQIVETED